MATAESRPHPTNLWTDAKLQKLPGDVRRLLDYLMTGPDVNAAGVTQIEENVIAARIVPHQLTVDTSIQILMDHGEAYVDWETREAWPVRWARFHKFEKPIAVKAFAKGMADTKSTELKRLISGKIKLKQSTPEQQQHQHQQKKSSDAAPAAASKGQDQTPGAAGKSCASGALGEQVGGGHKNFEEWAEYLRKKGARCRAPDLELDRKNINKLRSAADVLGFEAIFEAARGAELPSAAVTNCEIAGVFRREEAERQKVGREELNNRQLEERAAHKAMNDSKPSGQEAWKRAEELLKFKRRSA